LESSVVQVVYTAGAQTILHRQALSWPAGTAPRCVGLYWAATMIELGRLLRSQGVGSRPTAARCFSRWPQCAATEMAL